MSSESCQHHAPAHRFLSKAPSTTHINLRNPGARTYIQATCKQPLIKYKIYNPSANYSQCTTTPTW